MLATSLSRADASRSTRARWAWGSPIEATAVVLEIIGTEQAELLEFQSQALLNSTMGFAVRELATAFNVTPERVGETIGRACAHLDQLERYRRSWRDPVEVLLKTTPRESLPSPNLAALRCVCRARLGRTTPPARRQRLEKVLRKLDAAHELAQTRTWIDDFIGPIPAKARAVAR